MTPFKPFTDPYRGDGVFVSFGNWTFSIRKKWHLYFVKPPMKPGYVRFYFGPLEIERRPQ